MTPFKNRHQSMRHRVLAPLSVGEAAGLVRLAERAAAARGLPLRYDGGGALVGADGTVAGLSNLARALSLEARRRWPGLVEAHFDRIAGMVRAGPPPDWSDPTGPLYLRLAAVHGLPPGWAPDADEFVPGVLSVPATYADHTVAMHSDLTPLGLTRADATRIGLANLRRIPDDIEWLRHGGAEVARITGSMFSASRALVLDTVLRETLRVENPSHGTLVSFPVRDLLLVHVLRDESVLAAVDVMVSTAIQAYSSEPGPISPHVYYAAALDSESSRWRQVTDCSAGAMRVVVDGPMLSAVRRLGLAGE